MFNPKALILLSLITIQCNADSDLSETLNQNTDITDILNKKINENKNLTIPSGTYLINAEKSIILKNNTTIIMQPDTILKVIPNDLNFYQVFRIHNVKNASISGGVIIGDKYNHLNKNGEWGMGIDIKDSQNISINNITIEKMWGDAIYLGTLKNSNSNSDIYLNNIIMRDNRRQGISIISAQNLYASNLNISNTNGTPPSNGIDIEPNNDKNILKNINFSNIQTSKNKGNGFQISLAKLKSSEIQIDIKNHKDDGSYFGFIVNGVSKKINGNVKNENSEYNNSRHSNYCFNNLNSKKLIISLNKIKQDKNNNFALSKYCINYTNIENIVIKNSPK